MEQTRSAPFRNRDMPCISPEGSTCVFKEYAHANIHRFVQPKKHARAHTPKKKTTRACTQKKNKSTKTMTQQKNRSIGRGACEKDNGLITRVNLPSYSVDAYASGPRQCTVKVVKGRSVCDSEGVCLPEEHAFCTFMRRMRHMAAIFSVHLLQNGLCSNNKVYICVCATFLFFYECRVFF
jgi:hypothetical protein